MYCRNCGSEINPKAVICVSCGLRPQSATNFCQSCGSSTFPSDTVCVNCGVRLQSGGKDWLTTLLLCLFMGPFGVHRFYTGNIGIGVAQLLTMGGCGIWSLIDTIIIITGDYRDGDGNPLDKKS